MAKTCFCHDSLNDACQKLANPAAGPGSAGTRTSPFWILLELRLMEVVSGDNWSYKTCKAPVKSSSPTNQHPVFYRPDALPVTQPTVSDRLTYETYPM